MKKRYIITVLLIPVVFWLGIALLWMDQYRHKSVPAAVYTNMVALVPHGKVIRITVGDAVGSRTGQSDVYIHIPPEKVMRLTELTADDAKLLPLKGHEGTNFDGTSYTCYRDPWTMFMFERGRLVMGTIVESTDIYLSARPEGPFFKLPISKERLITEFGKPDRWGRGSTLGY